MTLYQGVNGVNREIKELHTGVSGINREIKELYGGVNGVNRLVYTSEFYITRGTTNVVPMQMPSSENYIRYEELNESDGRRIGFSIYSPTVIFNVISTQNKYDLTKYNTLRVRARLINPNILNASLYFVVVNQLNYHNISNVPLYRKISNLKFESSGVVKEFDIDISNCSDVGHIVLFEDYTGVGITVPISILESKLI